MSNREKKCQKNTRKNMKIEPGAWKDPPCELQQFSFEAREDHPPL